MPILTCVLFCSRHWRIYDLHGKYDKKKRYLLFWRESFMAVTKHTLWISSEERMQGNKKTNIANGATKKILRCTVAGTQRNKQQQPSKNKKAGYYFYNRKQRTSSTVVSECCFCFFFTLICFHHLPFLCRIKTAHNQCLSFLIP